MQIKSLLPRAYPKLNVDVSSYSKITIQKHEKLQAFKRLIDSGCSEATALEVLAISRTTLYRYKKKYKEKGLAGLEPKSNRPKNIRKPKWNKELEKLVLELRKQEPTRGKSKICTLIVREHGVRTSEATVGRIISNLIASNKVKPAYMAANKNKSKRHRIFNKHAQRWKYGMKGKKPGDMIQIDHMSVYCDGGGIKHFKAVCPVSRFMVCEVYSNATSATAAKFLDKVITDMPFKLTSVQVDGGSEFMKHFENHCAKKALKLLVLPPRSPKYNGKVERCNGITRDDFYSQYQDIFNVSTVKGHLQQFQHKYNNYRPHQALKNLTPMEYTKSLLQNRAC